MSVKFKIEENLDLLEEQVEFYQKHLDIFIEDQASPVKLKRQQKIISRAIGNFANVDIVGCRGIGKTWIVAMSLWALCTLHPGTIAVVASVTAAQATLVLQKLKIIADQNHNVANELQYNNSKNPISISNDVSECRFKNGSIIYSCSTSRMRGLRAKVVIIDEAPELNLEELSAVVNPLRNFKRDVCYNYNFDDYPSKLIMITSACPKNNTFYKEFLGVTRKMAQGDEDSFAIALDYKAAVANGLGEMSFFMSEKERLPQEVFDMEYGSIFAGSSSNAFFPFDLTQACRTLQNIELCQPKGSTSRYIISVDIATSEDKNADNSIISVLKFTECSDGSFKKSLVYMRSFHGKGLDIISDAVRNIYHLQFPSCEKIIYDARGLGDSFHKFMDSPWINPITGIEYPPIIEDTPGVVHNNIVIPILHPVRASQATNEKMATGLRVCLEKRNIQLPISYRQFKADNADTYVDKELELKESSVYREIDALQIEMSNIIQKATQAGHYIYDTPRHSLHKDRYSSFAMGVDYILELEEMSKKLAKKGNMLIGLDPTFY